MALFRARFCLPSMHLMCLGALLCVSLLLAACGSLADAQDRAETVDDAVSLLDDLENRDAWEWASEGLELLQEQDGFEARFSVTPIEADPAQTWIIQGDGQGNLLIARADAPQMPLLARLADEDRPTAYRLDAQSDTFVCIPADDPLAGLAEDGLSALLATNGVQSSAQQLLLMADPLDDDGQQALPDFLERAVIGYELRSLLPEALDVLARTEHEQLAARVEAATGGGEGSLLLDEDTLALLEYRLQRTDDAGSPAGEVAFSVTRWGLASDLPLPEAAQISQPCE